MARSSSSKSSRSSSFSKQRQKFNTRQGSTAKGTQWNTYKANKQFKKQMNKAEKNQPIYRDAYKGYKDAIAESLQNNNFEFDAGNGVYQDYANDYRLLGNIAADMSAENIEGLSGGYGTTYANTVAQQGLEGFLSNEKNILPSLYEQERQNYLQDVSNTINKGNLYNTLEAQDFAQFQDKLNRWNQNREFYYNKFLNDYNASAKKHEKTKSKEWSKTTSTTRDNERTSEFTTGTSTTVTPNVGGGSRGGRRGGRTTNKGYSKLTGNALKSRKDAMAYLSDNGLDASNVISKEQFAAENASRGWNAYNGALYEEGTEGYSEKAKRQLDSDYEDYLLNYIRQAQGLEDKDWFSKKQKKLGYSNRKH